MNAEETPDSARAVRCFVRGLGSGSLATLDAKHAGSPYNSLVTYACEAALESKDAVDALGRLMEVGRTQ